MSSPPIISPQDERSIATLAMLAFALGVFSGTIVTALVLTVFPIH